MRVLRTCDHSGDSKHKIGIPSEGYGFRSHMAEAENSAVVTHGLANNLTLADALRHRIRWPSLP